jgi:hypothetical protein
MWPVPEGVATVRNFTIVFAIPAIPMLRYFSLALCFVLGSGALGAANKEQDRLANCGVVMQEIIDIPDNGGESTDVVLLVMNTRGVDALLSSKVKLGGNASAAAGPQGRSVEASTDASLRAEILSYSRSRLIENTGTGIGKNKRTAETVGGGAALGTIIGAIAGGAKGAAIGVLVGAAGGAGIEVLNKRKDVRVPAETLLNFRLDRPVSLSLQAGR